MREFWLTSSILFSVRKPVDWLGDSPDLWVPDLHLDLDQAGSNHQSELMIVSIALSPWLHGYMVMVLHGFTWFYMVITSLCIQFRQSRNYNSLFFLS